MNLTPPSTSLRVGGGLGGWGPSFLAFAVLGPVLLHVVVALLTNSQLRDIWGVPLWTFIGVLILVRWAPDISERSWGFFVITWSDVASLLLTFTLLANVFGGAFRHHPRRIYYPGQQLSDEVTRRWENEFRSPLPLVAGDWWLAANVCVHADTPPILYSSREPASVNRFPRSGDPARHYSPDRKTSPWTSDDDFRRRGGVLLWDASVFGEDIPDRLRVRFPQAISHPPIVLPFQGGSRQELRVGCAILAPSSR